MKITIAIVGFLVLAVATSLALLLVLNGLASIAHGLLQTNAELAMTGCGKTAAGAAATGFSLLCILGVLDWIDPTGKTPRISGK